MLGASDVTDFLDSITSDAPNSFATYFLEDDVAVGSPRYSAKDASCVTDG